jgi:DNA-binding FadR family transcriptional regulator
MRRQATEESELEGLSRPSRGVGAISAQLRNAIEAGTYNKGDQLPPERELAVAFRAARSTVRRALDELQRAGLVSRKLGSGTFVTASSAANPLGGDVTEVISPLQLIDARCAVEPFTTRLAVLNATRRDLADMENVLARAEACNDDKDEFSKWDAEFHLLIARASRNPLALIFYKQINIVRLHAQWDAMKEKILTPEVIAEYHVQHRGIFRAINQRDAQLVETLIKEHLAKARDDLLQANSR